jgi:hypothetical protein
MNLKHNLNAWNFFTKFDPHLPPPVPQTTLIGRHTRKFREFAIKRYKRYLAIAALFTLPVLFLVGAFWLLVGSDTYAAHSPGLLVPFIVLMVGAKIFVPLLVIFGWLGDRELRYDGVEGFPEWSVKRFEREEGSEMEEVRGHEGRGENGRDMIVQKGKQCRASRVRCMIRYPWSEWAVAGASSRQGHS